MAKKLPPEELEKIKQGDLAQYLPQKPTDPGQQELFGTQKVSKKKAAKPKDGGAGRPRRRPERAFRKIPWALPGTGRAGAAPRHSGRCGRKDIAS